jgi:hypothetical protein
MGASEFELEPREKSLIFVFFGNPSRPGLPLIEILVDFGEYIPKRSTVAQRDAATIITVL